MDTNTGHTLATRREIPFRSASGYGMVALAIVLIAFGGASIFGARIVIGAPLIILGAIILPGLYMLQPNESMILPLFGNYRGTDRAEGLRWANPLYTGKNISLRARNLNTPPL